MKKKNSKGVSKAWLNALAKSNKKAKKPKVKPRFGKKYEKGKKPKPPKKSAKPRKKSGFKTHAMRVTSSSKKHTWRTPENLLVILRKFAKGLSTNKGLIGLDPCADRSEKRHFAKKNYTLFNDKDGLKETWRGFGLVYANPPYGRGSIIKWINKAIAEMFQADDEHSFAATGHNLRNKTDHVVLLVPARPDTKWFQETVLKHMHGLCFWKGRLKFSKSDPAPFPSLLIYLGSKPNRFKKIFRKYGWIIKAGKS